MNADWDAWIVRSAQKAFLDAFGSSVPCLVEGQDFDPAALAEWAELFVDGPRWDAGRAAVRGGTLTVSVNCFCRRTADVHRIDEIAGLAASALDRMDATVQDYPAASPTAKGRLRFREAETTRVDLGEEIPLAQKHVVCDARIEMTA